MKLMRGNHMLNNHEEVTMNHIPKKGFTIVELLIVIVVIGILASITIVGFRGVKNRAQDAAVASDITTIVKQMELYRTRNGAYPVGPDELKTMSMKVNKSAYSKDGVFQAAVGNSYNLDYCRESILPQEFAILAQSASGQIYMYKSVTQKLTILASAPPGDSVAVCNFAGITQTPGIDASYKPNNLFYQSDLGGWQDYAGDA